MKKFISGFVAGALLFGGVSVFAASGLIGQKVEGLYSIEKGGAKVADAVIINGSAYAPIRAVSAATGATLSVEGKKIIMSVSSDADNLLPDSVKISTLNNKITVLQAEIDRATGGINGYESMINMIKNAPGYDAIAHREKLDQLESKIAGEQQIIDKSKNEISDLNAQIAALQK
ncbi:hypothetical protein MKX42_30665 [Paenibacillus sp. FSL R7-0204]|uniref:hypothetical protein n=1 Tax=Paenibacillus sp. FSL R7-0204 TaxID=2921675 RepID=UPI0030FA6ACA